VGVSQLIQGEVQYQYKKAYGRYGRRKQRSEEWVCFSVKRVERIMLQIFEKWPNTSILSICAVVLSVVFLLGIVTAPTGKQTAEISDASQSSEMMKNQTVTAIPASGLPLEQYDDHRIIFIGELL
jgi:uncharacterized membrane protein